jgi:hypothetical protein
MKIFSSFKNIILKYKNSLKINNLIKMEKKINLEEEMQTTNQTLKIDKPFENLQSESLIINIKNDSKNDIKYPTFEDFTLEEQLKTDVTSEDLMTDLKDCHEALNYLQRRYDFLFIEHKNGKMIKEHLKDHNMNFKTYKVSIYVLERHVTLLYYLIILKYGKDETDKENIKKLLKERYINLDYKILEETFMNENKKYFKSLDNIEEDKQQILEIFRNVLKLEKSLIEFELKDEKFLPSIWSMNLSLKILKNTLDETSNQINEVILTKNLETISEESMIKFFHNFYKLEILSNFFFLCYKIPNYDIFNLPENSETWNEFKKHYERKIIYSRHIIKKKLQNVFNMITLGSASISKGFDQFSNKYSQIIGSGWYFAYFFFNKKQASIQNIKFSLNPNYDVAQTIWNMLDAKGIKNILKLALPRVKYSKKWFFRKTEPEIDLNTINCLIEEVRSGSFIESYKQEEKRQQRPDSIIMENIIGRNSLNKDFEYRYSINSSNSKIGGDLLIKSIDESNKNEYVKVRIINYKDFYVPLDKNIFSFMNCFGVEKNYDVNSLVIHIHGGGFIAMSSSSHENYTRKWTNKLEVPVFSIDYRLAPENPYPKALDDVYQAYMWIVKYAEEIMKLNIEKIILVGDSAGGNLVVALTYLLILKKKRMPDAIFLAYPGKIYFNVSIENFHIVYFMFVLKCPQ